MLRPGAVFLVVLAACSVPADRFVGVPQPGSDGGGIPGEGGIAAGDAALPIDAVGVDVPPHVPGNPGAGAHGLSFNELGQPSPTSFSTPPVTTQASRSTIVVSIGRGDISLFNGALPTDNKGNAPYQQIGTVHNYDPKYLSSGTALYAFPSASGGAGFQVSARTDGHDEITIAMVEVVDSSRIAASSWTMASAAGTVTSAPVTTTGAATLVAFWWGDGDQYDENLADPGDGFTPVDFVGKMASLVQCSVAVKNVAGGGTYTVSWTSKRAQGAQLWLVAVD